MESFKDVIVKERKKSQIPAYIYGSAPSIININKFELSGVKIAIGDMGWRAPEFGPYDFWVTNNTYFPLPWKEKHLTYINKSNAITFISSASIFGLQQDENLQEVLKQLKTITNESKIVFYDSSHLSGGSCIPIKNCCLVVKEFNLKSSPQEELAKLVNERQPAYKGQHQLLHAIALAILLNCNPIVINGVEFPETMKKYRWYKNWKNPLALKLRVIILLQQYLPMYNKKKTDFAGDFKDHLFTDLDRIRRIADSLNVKLYITSKTSPLNNLEGFTFTNNNAYKP
jgi:hypothetical protein